MADTQETSATPSNDSGIAQPHGSPDDLNTAADKLKSLMNDEGDLPPHGPEDEGEAPAGTKAADTPAKEVTQEEPAQDNPPAAIKLSIGDKEFTIPADSIPEELRDVVKDGLMMRADYSRKTAEVAEGRKLVEAMHQHALQQFQLVQSMAPQLGTLQALDAQIARYQNVDWATLQANDPIEYSNARHAFRDIVDQRANLSGQLQRATQQMQLTQAQRLQETMAKAIPEIKKEIPDWSPEKATELRNAGKSIGIPDEALDSVYEPWQVKALNIVNEWMKLQSQKTQVTKKVEKLPPKQIRSGNSNSTEDGPRINQSAMDRLQKRGKVEDAAAAIRSLMG